MNIAIISHPTFPVPPYDGYGGVQRGIYDLSVGLADKGHTIYVFCTKTSKIDYPNVHKIAIADRGIAEQGQCDIATPNEADVIQNISRELDILIAQNKIDIINVRWEDRNVQDVCKSKGLPLLMSVHCHIPTSYCETLYDKDLPYTFHTEIHKNAHPTFKTGVVNEYAIQMDHIPTSSLTLSECQEFTADIPPYLKDLWQQKQDYLVYVSGIRRQKSQASALKIAHKAGVPIVLAGSPSTKEDFEYFTQEIKPHINDKNVLYVPNVNEADKYNLLKYAKGFIFAAGQEDATWVEPFGRVISESIATGTPVVGYKEGGSILNQVIHGKNGYVYETTEEAVRYVELLANINRQHVALDARERLGIGKFITATEQTLLQTIQAHHYSYIQI